MGDTKIILCMIVKNEARIIERCIGKCEGLISGIAITDTGSTDDTKDKIIQMGKKLSIPTKVYSSAFKNFGVTRTISYQNCQEFAKDNGFNLKNSYGLLLDADMMLEIYDDELKLTHIGYSLIQYNYCTEWTNLRLVRLDCPWKCVGATHEYWSFDDGTPIPRIRELKILDIGDGGSKGDKFERDIRLLQEELESNPTNSRDLFYLGESFRNRPAKNGIEMVAFKKQSIKYYNKYIKLSNWPEEKFYALYSIGQCFNAIYTVAKEKGPKTREIYWNRTVNAYLEAYNFHPTRNESLMKLATLYRSEGKNKLCYIMAKLASLVPFPKDEVLFIEKNAYSGILTKYEMSIAGFYDPKTRRECFEYCDGLTRDNKADSWMRENCHHNLLHYYSKYSDEADLMDRVFSPDIKLPMINEDHPEWGTYHPTNPSIIKYKDGYLANIRTVNYIQENLRYFFADGRGIVHTRNYLCFLNKDLQIVWQKEIKNLENKGNFSDRISGFEDIRIFEHSDNIWFTATVVSNKDIPKIILCRVPEFQNSKDITIREYYYFTETSEGCEKNWLPFSYNNKIHIIYHHHPHKLLVFENGTLNTYKEYKYEDNLSKWRGSAIPIKIGNNYLGIIHETIYENKAFYLSRWVWYTPNFIIDKISLPFYFINKGVEFCCGLALAQEKGSVIVGVGNEDRSFKFIKYDLELIKSCLSIKIERTIAD